MNKLRKLLFILGLPIVALAQTNSLTSTTLSSAIAQPSGSTPPAQFITVASATGINVPAVTNGTQGSMLLIDREAVRVIAQVGTTTTFQVIRGQEGTRAVGHVSGATVWIGNPQWYKNKDPLGTCTLGTEYSSPWINATTGAIYICNAGGVYGLANGIAWVPASNCWMTATTTAFSPAVALVRAAAGNQVLNGTTNSTAGTVTVDCDISGTESELFGYPGGVTITGVSLLYGDQTTALSSIATVVIDTVTYPASTAAGAAAAGTVAAAGGTLTVTPTTLQLTTTTTGQCFNEFVSFGTPYQVSTNNQRLTLEQVFTTAGSTATTLQVCGLEIYFTTNPPAITPPQ